MLPREHAAARVSPGRPRPIDAKFAARTTNSPKPACRRALSVKTLKRNAYSHNSAISAGPPAPHQSRTCDFPFWSESSYGAAPRGLASQQTLAPPAPDIFFASSITTEWED
jgi:hypothetical protein